MIRHFTKIGVVAASLIAAGMISTSASAGGLNLTVDGVRNASGTIMVLVFDDAAAFEQLDWQNAIGYADIPARMESVSHSFSNLTGGPYAIFLFHDENGDQDLNVSGERLLEGIGASGADTATSEPSFAEAAVAPGDVAVRIFYDR